MSDDGYLAGYQDGWEAAIQEAQDMFEDLRKDVQRALSDSHRLDGWLINNRHLEGEDAG